MLPLARPRQTLSMVAPDSVDHFHKYFHEFFPLLSCSAACRVGMFGRNCQQSCGADLNCRGLRFCLPDPYGCSCASGWFGSRCEKGQPASVSAKTGVSRDLSRIFCRLSRRCSPRRQPVTTTRTDRTACSAAAARTEEFATASVVATVRRGGGDTAVRNQVPAKPCHCNPTICVS